MSAYMDGLKAMSSAIADGYVIQAAAREAATYGQWTAAAEMLEAWAARIATAAETVSASELPPMDDETLASVTRTAACTARMHRLAIDAANYAWSRAALESGAVA
jgi:hypothetical protein